MTDNDKIKAIFNKCRVGSVIYFNGIYESVLPVLIHKAFDEYIYKISANFDSAHFYFTFILIEAYDKPELITICEPKEALAKNGILYIGDRCVAESDGTIIEAFVHHFTETSVCLSKFIDSNPIRYINRALSKRKIWKL